MRHDASRLDWAITLAVRAHCAQADKQGMPYIKARRQIESHDLAIIAERGALA